MLLTFLNNIDYIYLQWPLKTMSGIAKRQYAGALHFLRDAQCFGAIEFFTVMVFFNKGDAFKGFTDILAPGTQATILDIGLLDIYNKEVYENITYIESLRIKRNLLIKQCIQKYCI